MTCTCGCYCSRPSATQLDNNGGKSLPQHCHVFLSVFFNGVSWLKNNIHCPSVLLMKYCSGTLLPLSQTLYKIVLGDHLLQ